MINLETILSNFNERGTLLKMLHKVEDALEKSVLTSISIETPTYDTVSFIFNFADGTQIKSPPTKMPFTDAKELIKYFVKTKSIEPVLNTDDKIEFNFGQQYTDDKNEINAKIAAKQDKLISGTNIKTVGGQSLLGAGDIPLSGGCKLYEHTITFTYYHSGMDDNVDFDFIITTTMPEKISYRLDAGSFYFNNIYDLPKIISIMLFDSFNDKFSTIYNINGTGKLLFSVATLNDTHTFLTPLREKSYNITKI